MNLTNIIRSALLGAIFSLGCASNNKSNQNLTIKAIRATTNAEGLADFPGTEQDILVKDTADNPLSTVEVIVYQVHKNGEYHGDVYLARTSRDEGGMNMYLHYNNQGAYLLAERELIIRRSPGLTSFDQQFQDILYDVQRWALHQAYSCDGVYTTEELIAGRERTVRLISYLDPTGLVEQAYDKVEWLIENGFLRDLPPGKEWFVVTSENPTAPSELIEKNAARSIFSRADYSRLERACGGIIQDGGTGEDGGTTLDGGSLTAGAIAFDSFRDGSINIYRMNTDGRNVIRITNRPSLEPVWSPDGQKIAYTDNQDGNLEIYVMNADGTNPVNLTRNSGNDSKPAWSPDGRKIGFQSDRDGNPEIYSMNADGSNQTRLTNHPTSDEEPTWSADSSLIAFASRRNIQREIYVMNADGSNQRNITNHPAGENTSPAWSPDGRTILFISGRDGSGDLYRMNPDGSNQVRVTTGYGHVLDPAWSPDSQHILFSSDKEGNFEIYSANATGRDIQRLTTHSSNDTSPAWSPG
ncbi:PD40 domain-containing protein [Candidatus Woesearchaeota archaeon]|nr:PD40 domain-containing protein [Candidatus Woesearchaeota archaeon]